MSGDIEEQVLYLERQYWQLPDPAALRKRLVALEQQLAQLWMTSGFPAGPPVANTPFSGTIKGCNSLGVAASALTLKDASSGAVLWTGASDATGNYSGSIFLSANTAVNMDITPASARLVARTGVGAATLAAGSSNTIAAIALSPATGYICTNSFGLPLKTTLLLQDSRFGGPITLTWNGTTKWIGTDGTHSWGIGAPSLASTVNGSGTNPTFNAFSGAGGNTGPESTQLNYIFNPGAGTQSPPWFTGDTLTVTEPP